MQRALALQHISTMGPGACLEDLGRAPGLTECGGRCLSFQNLAGGWLTGIQHRFGQTPHVKPFNILHTLWQVVTPPFTTTIARFNDLADVPPPDLISGCSSARNTDEEQTVQATASQIPRLRP